MNKWKALLLSRKFWTSIVGIGVSVGILAYSDVQQAELVEAIVIIVGTAFYVISVALEDGLTKVAASQEKMAEAQRMTKIQDAIKEYNTQQAAQRSAERATRR